MFGRKNHHMKPIKSLTEHLVHKIFFFKTFVEFKNTILVILMYHNMSISSKEKFQPRIKSRMYE